jgi:hypothetical protein
MQGINDSLAGVKEAAVFHVLLTSLFLNTFEMMVDHGELVFDGHVLVAYNFIFYL